MTQPFNITYRRVNYTIYGAEENTFEAVVPKGAKKITVDLTKRRKDFLWRTLVDQTCLFGWTINDINILLNFIIGSILFLVAYGTAGHVDLNTSLSIVISASCCYLTSLITIQVTPLIVRKYLFQGEEDYYFRDMGLSLLIVPREDSVVNLVSGEETHDIIYKSLNTSVTQV